MIKKVDGKYVLYSKSKSGGHRKRLGTYTSRAGAMKREKQIQYFKHLKEEAAVGNAMSTGNVAISPVAAIVKKGKKKDNKPPKLATLKKPMKNLEEEVLREAIRRLIALSTAKYYEEIGEKTLQEAQLRRVIRALLTEKSEPIPYKNTGLNTAADVLQRIKRTIVDAYKTLTSSEEQRRDFTNTVEELVKKAIEQQDYMKEIDKNSVAAPSETPVTSLEEADEEGVDTEEPAVDLGDETAVPLGEPEETDQEKASKRSKEIATDVTAAEPDTTGGAKAMPVITTIVPQILLARDSLKDEKDKKAFDLAILGGNGKIGNIKAFINLAEKELTATVSGASQGSLADELASDAEGEAASAETEPTAETGTDTGLETPEAGAEETGTEEPATEEPTGL